MTEPGFPPLWIVSLSPFSVQTTCVSLISGKVLCKHGPGVGDRKSQSAWDQSHVLEQLLTVPPVVISRILVWGMSHVVTPRTLPPSGDWILRRWVSGAGPAGFKEHVRKPWNWVTCIWVLVLGPFYSVTLGRKSLQAQLSAQGWLFLSSSFAALFPRFPGMPKYGQAHILPMAFARIHINYPLSSNSLLKCQYRNAFMTTPFKIANDSPAKNISPSLPILIFKNPDTFWLIIYVTYLSCLYSLCPSRISVPEGQDVCLFLFKLLYPWDHQQHLSCSEHSVNDWMNSGKKWHLGISFWNWGMNVRDMKVSFSFAFQIQQTFPLCCLHLLSNLHIPCCYLNIHLFPTRTLSFSVLITSASRIYFHGCNEIWIGFNFFI